MLCKNLIFICDLTKELKFLYFLQSRDLCILKEEHTVTMTIYSRDINH